MNPLELVVPPWVKPALIALAFVVTGAGGAYIGWELKAGQDAKAVIAEQKATIKMEVDQAAVSGKVAEKVEQAKEKIRIVYRDREQEIKQHDNDRASAGQAPVYSPVDAPIVGGCVVPQRLVSVWNTANASQLPDPASLDDAAPSRVGLRDVEAQHDTEAAITRQLTIEYRGLQLWVCEQALLHNGVLPDFEVCKLGEIK